jgi:MFS family permease
VAALCCSCLAGDWLDDPPAPEGFNVAPVGLVLASGSMRGALASRFVVGKLVEWFGARAVTIASFLLAAVATVPFALAGPGTSLWWLGAVLLVRGLGVGAVLIPPMSVAYQNIQPTGIQHAIMNTRIAPGAPPARRRSRRRGWDEPPRVTLTRSSILITALCHAHRSANATLPSDLDGDPGLD